jgi:hypothetical protein
MTPSDYKITLTVRLGRDDESSLPVPEITQDAKNQLAVVFWDSEPVCGIVLGEAPLGSIIVHADCKGRGIEAGGRVGAAGHLAET